MFRSIFTITDLCARQGWFATTSRFIDSELHRLVARLMHVAAAHSRQVIESFLRASFFFFFLFVNVCEYVTDAIVSVIVIARFGFATFVRWR
jgi:hypothetical protein